MGAYTVLSASVTLRERARTARSVIDASTHIGRSALIEGAVIGRSCDIRSHVRIHEGVAIGDEVTIGAESVVMPGVRIYPYKEVESGAQIHEHLIWESRARSRLFGADGVEGLVNIDLTPEIAVRVGAALGTALKRDARVVASREGPPACRLVKRAIISGLISTGVAVADLRVITAPVARHLVKTEGYDAGVHVGVSASDPELVQVRFFERPGTQLTPALQKEIEKHFTRQELRRVSAGDVGDITYPARATEAYSQELLATLDVDAIRARGFRIVVDYGFSAASFVLPLVLGPLGVEAVSAHAFATDRSGQAGLRGLVGQTKKLVGAIGADLGVVLDRAAERVYLVDERGREIPVEQALLLFLRLIAGDGRAGKLAFPVTVTSQVDQMVEGSSLEVIRTPASLADLTRTAAQEGVIFAGAVGGGYVFPQFIPAYDAVASLCNLLELLAPIDRPVSELVAELPSRRSCTARSLPVGAQGLRHARGHRAAEGPRRRPHGRHQGLRRARLGAGARRPGRAARPRLRRGAERRRVRASSRASCARSSRRCCRRRVSRRGQYPQPEVDPSGSCCFNPVLEQNATERAKWIRSPISQRSPTRS